MTRKTDLVKGNINNYLNVLRKKINVSKVILFGSYKRNSANKSSDIDIAVISKDFDKMSFYNRLVLLGKIAWQSKTTIIEPLGFTLKEYNNAQPWDFISEISKTGKVIYSAKR